MKCRAQKGWICRKQAKGNSWAMFVLHPFQYYNIIIINHIIIWGGLPFNLAAVMGNMGTGPFHQFYWKTNSSSWIFSIPDGYYKKYSILLQKLATKFSIVLFLPILFSLLCHDLDCESVDRGCLVVNDYVYIILVSPFVEEWDKNALYKRIINTINVLPPLRIRLYVIVNSVQKLFLIINNNNIYICYLLLNNWLMKYWLIDVILLWKGKAGLSRWS